MSRPIPRPGTLQANHARFRVPLIQHALAALFAMGVVWFIGMRFSAPHRHNREFQRKLPFFERVISDLQAASTPDSATTVKIPVPEDARDMAYSIVAERPSQDRLAVEFITSVGFPVKHRGFLFLSAGGIEDYPKMASRWPKRTPLRDNWIYIGD